jgi:hypothetical protein
LAAAVSESYEVVTAALADHARLLDDLAGQLRAAGQSAMVSMTGDAYGQTGERFATMIEDVAGAGRDTLQAGVDALEAAGANLRDIANAYDRQEIDAATGYAGILSELP